jgi:hypothetical protein
MAFSIIYLLNGASHLAVALIAFYIYFSFWKKKEKTGMIGNLIGANGIFYLAFGFLNFLWIFEFLEPSREDFILMVTALTVISAVLLLYVVYKITNNKNLLYLLILFITSVFAINFSLNAFFLSTMVISYLLIIIVFLDLFFFSNYYLKRAGFLGLFYTIISILLLVLIFFGLEPARLFWFIPNTLIFFVLLFIYLDVKQLGIIKIERYKYKKKRFTFLSFTEIFVKFIVFIISISIFILISSVAIHELGHALIAQYYGCEHSKAVIYDIIKPPHTEIRCNEYYNNVILTLGGIMFTFVIAFIFLLTGGVFTTTLSYLIFGFALLISYGDLSDLGISKNIIVTIMFLSLVIIIFAIIRISVYYLKQQDIFKKGINNGVKKIYDSKKLKIRKILKYETKNLNIKDFKK